jgi:chromosome segregation ATPase
MDPDGDGQVTLQEFSDWWDVHVKGHGAEGGGRDGADPEELATLRAEAAAAKQEAAECGAQVESLRERAEQAEADAGQAGERLQSETAAAAEAVAAAKQAVAAAKQAEAAVMERAVKAEAELETARASGPPRPSAGDEEASTGLQDTVELLERLLRARDEEVTDQTAKLQSFASETQKLLHELEVANTKMSKMATQYQQLEQELEESDARLETVTGKNVELLERMAALRLAEGDRV